MNEQQREQYEKQEQEDFKNKLDAFFMRFEDYLRAFIRNDSSEHVEDAVKLSQMRDELIKWIVREQ